LPEKDDLKVTLNRIDSELPTIVAELELPSRLHWLLLMVEPDPAVTDPAAPVNESFKSQNEFVGL
jgi:hypothetical protein